MPDFNHPRVIVITGPEPALVDREVASVLNRLKANIADAEVVTIDCSRKATVDDASATGIAERLFQSLSPSLFGEAPIVVVRSCEMADDATQQVLKDTFGDRAGSPIVIAHSGAAKGRGVVNAAKRAKAEIIKCQRPNERDVRNLMRLEAREAGGSLTPQAEQWLLDSIGTDALGILLAAVRQSVSDSGGQPVQEENVHAIFPMQAKVSAFKVVDHLWAGRVDEAAGLLRGMEQREKGAGISVLAAIAHGLRMMSLYGRPGAKPSAGAKVAPWQIDRARENARKWGASGARIAAVAARLPGLDADMKGGLDGGIALDDEQKMAVLEALVIRLSTVP